MDESRLRTIEQIAQFFSASALVVYAKHADDSERREHMARVLTRFAWGHFHANFTAPSKPSAITCP